jgi:hypothetical protein
MGYVSQPAHARLAGAIARGLAPDIFGELPSEVLDAIEMHDVGWASIDLTGLEGVTVKHPTSFLACPPRVSVNAWQLSIRQAEARSTLAGIVTSRHFCALAPRERDDDHNIFLNHETNRLRQVEKSAGFDPDDLGRYTAAIGFCDLLSLCLCSGLLGSYGLPLAHPADPIANLGARVNITIGEMEISCTSCIFLKGFQLSVEYWLLKPNGALSNSELKWMME